MKIQTFAGSLLLLARFGFAQTTTACNPTKKSCPADPALSSKIYTHSFADGLDGDNWNITAGNVTSTSSGLHFTINRSGDAPTIRSKWYIFFGRVSFVFRTAPGTGIVSSAILLSDDLDEIDWEFLGGEPTVAQTNYFGKAQTSTLNRAASLPVSNTQSASHNFTIVWTKDSTQWIVDDVVLRTLTSAEAVAGGNTYPQTPMDVRIGIWAGGDPENEQGTIEWAGGETDYSKAPFEMVLESVEVENYTPAEQYSFGDMSGTWESIEVEGSESSAGQTKDSKSANASAAATESGKLATQTEKAVAETASASASAIVNNQQSGAATKTICASWIPGVVGVMLATMI